MRVICSKVAYRWELCPRYTCHIRHDTPKRQSLIRSFLIIVLTTLSVVVTLPARFNGFIIFGIICSSLLRCTLLCPSLGLLWLSFQLAQFLPPGSLACFFCPVLLNLPQLDSFLPCIFCLIVAQLACLLLLFLLFLHLSSCTPYSLFPYFLSLLQFSLFIVFNHPLVELVSIQKLW